MTTINISLPDQMKEFVDEEMGDGGYRDPSDYFNALLQEQGFAQKVIQRRNLG
jgi:antitoxin ParD1/3/4